MGKRVSISQPTVIQTELRPLSESFWIDANGQLEQWYYQNTGVFSPDRQITALRLKPMLSLLDLDTNASYSSEASQEATEPPLHVSIQNVVWTVKEWNGSTWVETNISSVTAGDPYHTEGNDLIVSKNNYDAAHAINIKCRCNYADPRDIGTTCWLETTLMLVTNMDATQVYPTIDIKNPSARMFNPLKDDPIYEFEAEANWDVLEGQGGTDITEYKVDALGTEKILPANEDMLVNAAPVLDIKYGDTDLAQQQFMERQVSGGVVSDIPDGLAKIDNIKGNTVKWNQTLPYGNSTYANWYAMYGTKTLLNNVLNYTITDAHPSARIECTNQEFAVGHIYYLCGFMNPPKNTVGSFYVTQYTQNVVCSANVWTKVSGLTTIGSSTIEYGFYCNMQRTLAVGDIVQFKQIMRIDLTLMFGAGNEPATAADFEAWLAANIGLKDYYPYTTGKLINYGGFSVKWNQIIKNGNFFDGTSQWTSFCSTLSASNGVLTITKKSTESQSGVGGIAEQPISLNTSHKYYMSCIAKTNVASIGLTMTFLNTSHVSGGNVAAYSESQSYVKLSQIASPVNSNDKFAIRTGNSVSEDGVSCDVKNVNLIDLTAMFGAGNEPDLAWCNKYLSRDYYDYCAGIDKNILDVAEVKTAGFNKWDEEWENGIYDPETGQKIIINPNDQYCIRCKNYIPVIPNTYYYANKAGAGYIYAIFFYDKNKNYLSYRQFGTNEFQIPRNSYYITFRCYMAYGATYNHDICINIYDASRNGTYEPYKAQFEKLPMGVKSSGFNIWDEQWELGDISSSTGDNVSADNRIRTKNFVKVLPNKTYYIKYGSVTSGAMGTVTFYDSEKNLISGAQVVPSVASPTFTTPASASYLKVAFNTNYGTVYHNNICINISDPLRNGTYEAHWESFSDMSWLTKIGIENFNIWDEEWDIGDFRANSGKQVEGNYLVSKNYIKVDAGKSYCISSINEQGSESSYRWVIYEYGANKGFIQWITYSKLTDIYTPSSGTSYIKFRNNKTSSSYNHDICINESVQIYNGNYLPHGQTMPYFPNGLCNIGNVYDEVKVENGKIKGVKRIYDINMGDIDDWSKLDMNTDKRFMSQYISNVVKHYSDSHIVNALCSRYKVVNSDRTSEPLALSIGYGSGKIYVNDTNYSTVDDFKASLNGVHLSFELGTPAEFEIDYPTKGQFEWYGIDGSGNEVPIDTLPVYSQAEQPSGYGQHSSRIRINALYGENIPVILRVKRYPWNNVVLPPKITKSVAWKTPPLDVVVTSNKGSAVRSEHLTTPTNFTFSAIVNQQGEVISDAKKQENLVFKWYYVKYGVDGQAATPVLAGQGLTIDVSTNTLKNSTPLQQGAVKQSTNVYCEVYLLGAYHLVNGTYVRSIE